MTIAVFSPCIRRTWFAKSLVRTSSCFGLRPQLFLRSYAMNVDASAPASASAKRSPPDSPTPQSKRAKHEEEHIGTPAAVNEGDGTPSPKKKQQKRSRHFRKPEQGKTGRGEWGRRRGTRPEGEAGSGSEAEDGAPKALRLPKRKCALLMGFTGSGYSGMQMYVICL
jgi:hypothetical protein